jgi:type IV pilus assembly protein PilA
MTSKISLCSTSRRAQSNGFTLMELLIVMAIIAILMLIAIPTVGSLKKKANELSAQKSIQTIMTSENMYESNYPTTALRARLPHWAETPNPGLRAPRPRSSSSPTWHPA